MAHSRIRPKGGYGDGGWFVDGAGPSFVGFVCLGALWLAIGVACSPPPPVVAPVVVAPRPIEYTCQQQRRLADELDVMPAGAMARTAIVDYGRERDQLRALHRIPRPAECPK